MRLTVTPIGAVGASAARVAADVVDYLEGGKGDPGVALIGGGGVSSYYADSGEGPGRWLGAGAAFHRLGGVVDPDSFQRVLEGRHPSTGARLVTARGSSQRQHLAVGTAAAFDANGDALYTIGDAARLLGVRRRDVEEMIEAAIGDGSDRGWLASVPGPVGVLVPDREISRHLELAATAVTAADVLGDGDRDELLTVSQVARLLRVTPQYVRRLCDRYQRGEGEGSRGRAFLASQRACDRSTAPHLIRRGDVADFAARRRPPVARVGFDVTLTCEKSFGLLAMLGTGDLQQRVVRALRVANETAMEHLDLSASVARKGGGAVHTEGLLVASYFHGTSRALDPHPHHHNVVANAVVDEHGDVRTLDGRALYRHAPAAAALATAAARWELRDLGLGWWRRDDGVWEVAGIDEPAIREFSRRRNEMDEVRAALEERLGRPITHEEENTVALSTRPGKDAVDADALVADWRRRAVRVGLDIDRCLERRHDRAISNDVLSEQATWRLFYDLAAPGDGLCAESNTFDRGDVLRAITDWAITDDSGRTRKVLLPPGEIERLADRFCASALVVQLDAAATGGVIRRRDGTTVSDGQHEPVYCTTELLDVEAEIITRYRNGRHSSAGQVADHVAHGVATSDGTELSDEQLALVRSWCTSGDRVQAAVGRAGTGKTTTMRAATNAWRAAGFRVIGCAVKGEAARQLAADAAIEADTVAMLLTRAGDGHQVLDRHTVVIVDEASTIGDRDLLTLLRLADTAGATVRLIGDTAQHGSVAAGGSFAQLVALGGADTPQLNEVRRLRDPGQRRRAELVRSGQITEALDELQASGQLTLTDSDAETYAAMLDRWYQHRRAGEAHPMVHGRNRQRRLLNQIAQAVLAVDGTVHVAQAVTTSDGRRLAVGDDVIARHGDRSIHPVGDRAAWMRNGTTGRIVAVQHGDDPVDDQIKVHTAAGLIDCPRRVFDRPRGGIDLGYAVTSYAVQGSTRSASTSAVTASTARSELYVDITRGRNSNQLYATQHVADGDSAEAHLPRLDSELLPMLQHQLARGTVRTALALDPAALATARTRRGRNLLVLLSARRRGETGPIDETIRRTVAGVRRQARSTPPSALRLILPARPRCPHLAARWDVTAGDVAVHLASTPTQRPTSSRPPMERVLGPRPDDPADHNHWEDLATRVAELAADITLWDFQQQAPPAGTRTEPPGWLRPFLCRRAVDGQLATGDLPTLRRLIDDIDIWRRDQHIDDADTVLGPRPSDSAARAQFDRLARRIERRDPPRSGRSVA